MLVTSIISTKGGVGKTTIAANLGAFLADAGLRVLLLDLDVQPTLSSYYKLVTIANCGVYELIASNEKKLEQLISYTTITDLHLIYSNDSKGQLHTLLLHAPDGRFRLKNLLPIFESNYDIMLVDTQGSRVITLEMAIIASDMIISPVTPEALSAREFRRGTLELMQDMVPYQHLGITLPNIHMLINKVPPVSKNAQLIKAMLLELFKDHSGIKTLKTFIPAIEAYAKSSTLSKPVYRIEYSKPSLRRTPAALETMKALASELFPQWAERFQQVTGKTKGIIYAS